MTHKRVDIPRRRLSEETLRDAFVRSVPTIFEDAAAAWPARTKWTRDYIASALADVGIPRQGGGQMRFQEFLDFAAPPDGVAIVEKRDLYPAVLKIFDAVVPELATAGVLRDDIVVPELIAKDTIASIVLWITGAQRNPLHTDLNGCANLNYSILGEKTAMLFHPSEAQFLYPTSVIMTEEQSGQQSLIDRGAANCFAELPRELDDPSRLEAFPLFERGTRWEGTWEEGEMLYIPPSWWHWIHSVAPLNVNVTIWFWFDSLPLNATTLRWAFQSALRQVAAGKPIDDASLSLLKSLEKAFVSDGSVTDPRQYLYRIMGRTKP